MGRRKTLDEVRATAEQNHPGITSLLGTRSDPDVADYYELSVCRIQILRTQLGIPPFNRVVYFRKPGPARLDDDEIRLSFEQRHPGILNKLGVLPDSQIACHYGVSRQRIFSMRKRLSISRAPQNTSCVPAL